MTTLTLVQNAGIAIDQAIGLIISENKIDEALNKLNEAKVFTIEMEQMINPPKLKRYSTLKKEVCDAFGVPQESLFTHSRKREVVSARQVYVYLIRKTKLPKEDPIQKANRDSENKVGRHITFDHATVYHCENKAQDYYDTEPFYKALIDRLQKELIEGKLDMPEIK